MTSLILTPEREARFWQMVDKSGDCWVWTAHKNEHGYGLFSINNQSKRAHRIAYTMAFGEIPEGLVVCHHCDNRRCVRPDHLFLGTKRDNTHDAMKKGRLTGPRKPAGKIVNDPNAIATILREHDRGASARSIARQFGVDHRTIRSHLARNGRHASR